MPSPENAGLSAVVSRARQAYDETPYDTAPVLRTHPGRLSAQAVWNGIAAPDAARARVLEIGCATGGNLLPLGAQIPGASFLGVDLSPRQIAAAEQRRAVYGLGNVEFRADSFEALSDADGEFDFILAHGVYAWIPEALRDALLRVIRARLAPNGIAFVSFNVLPGWRVHQAVRDSLMLHAGDIADPQARAEKAHELFETLARECDTGDDTYGNIWRREAPKLRSGGDSYIAHEFFEESNNPETFAHFAARATRFDLAYLSESTAVANNETDMAPKGWRSVLAMSGGDRLKRETYIDIFSGRTFREALLVRGGRADALAATPQGLESLHFIPALELEFGATPDSAQTPALRLKTSHLPIDPPAVAAMRDLVARKPASCRLADLAPDGPARDAALAALRAAVAAGLVATSTLPVRCANVLSERPRLWPLAARDAQDSFITTTLRHSPFRFAPFQRLIGPLMDGARRRDDLIAAALDVAARGGFPIDGPDGPITEPGAIRARIAGAVDRALAGFLRAGLLEEA